MNIRANMLRWLPSGKAISAAASAFAASLTLSLASSGNCSVIKIVFPPYSLRKNCASLVFSISSLALFLMLSAPM